MGGAVETSGKVQEVAESRQATSELAHRDRLSHAVKVGTCILVKAESLDQGMPEALGIVGESIKVDRILVMQEGPNHMSPPPLRYVWQMQGIPMPFEMSSFRVSATDVESPAAWREQMKEGNPPIAQLATSAGSIPSLLESFQNNSTLEVPIFVGGNLWGNLAIDLCAVAREWTTNEIDLIKTFGDATESLFVHSETRVSLETSEESFRVLGAAAADAIIMIDGAGHIIYWNRAAERILGYSAEEAVGKPVHEFLAPARFEDKASQGMKSFVLTGQGAALGKTTELAALRKDGTEIVVELSLSGALVGSDWQAIGILRDITKSKQAAAHALRAACFDELTGLANRSVFVDALQHAIAIAERGEMGFAVVINMGGNRATGGNRLVHFADRTGLKIRRQSLTHRLGGHNLAGIINGFGGGDTRH